jgi:hypothetical protein
LSGTEGGVDEVTSLEEGSMGGGGGVSMGVWGSAVDEKMIMTHVVCYKDTKCRDAKDIDA